MRILKIWFTICFNLILFLSCNKSNSTKNTSVKNKKEKDTAITELSRYDLESENPTIIKLPGELKEISGLTMTPDGRLFGEEDEKGYVYQIDYTNGKIIKKFALGNPVVKEDFEDIAYVNDKFYLLKSNGSSTKARRQRA